jgi:hypothetical protein
VSTEAVIVTIAVAVVLITLVTYLAGRSARPGEPAQDVVADPDRIPPGYANEAAYAQVANGAQDTLRSERDATIGDTERDDAWAEDMVEREGRFTRSRDVQRRL